MPVGTPLQNRVTPTGEIVAVADRGLFMGNRGGRIHDPATQTLTRRRWTNRHWICCLTQFKNRSRTIMGEGYTELFFLDEVTALSAGHRPCFECRRKDAQAFADAFARGTGNGLSMKADQMDRILHADRLSGRIQRHHIAHLGDLPDGAMLLWNGRPTALKSGLLFTWSSRGYETPEVPTSLAEPVTVLTPKSVLSTLSCGYAPVWHPSAEL